MPASPPPEFHTPLAPMKPAGLSPSPPLLKRQPQEGRRGGPLLHLARVMSGVADSEQDEHRKSSTTNLSKGTPGAAVDEPRTPLSEAAPHRHTTGLPVHHHSVADPREPGPPLSSAQLTVLRELCDTVSLRLYFPTAPHGSVDVRERNGMDSVGAPAPVSADAVIERAGRSPPSPPLYTLSPPERARDGAGALTESLHRMTHEYAQLLESVFLQQRHDAFHATVAALQHAHGLLPPNEGPRRRDGHGEAVHMGGAEAEAAAASLRRLEGRQSAEQQARKDRLLRGLHVVPVERAGTCAAPAKEAVGDVATAAAAPHTTAIACGSEKEKGVIDRDCADAALSGFLEGYAHFVEDGAVPFQEQYAVRAEMSAREDALVMAKLLSDRYVVPTLRKICQLFEQLAAEVDRKGHHPHRLCGRSVSERQPPLAPALPPARLAHVTFPSAMAEPRPPSHGAHAVCIPKSFCAVLGEDGTGGGLTSSPESSSFPQASVSAAAAHVRLAPTAASTSIGSVSRGRSDSERAGDAVVTSLPPRTASLSTLSWSPSTVGAALPLTDAGAVAACVEAIAEAILAPHTAAATAAVRTARCEGGRPASGPSAATPSPPLLSNAEERAPTLPTTAQGRVLLPRLAPVMSAVSVATEGGWGVSSMLPLMSRRSGSPATSPSAPARAASLARHTRARPSHLTSLAAVEEGAMEAEVAPGDQRPPLPADALSAATGICRTSGAAADRAEDAGEDETGEGIPSPRRRARDLPRPPPRSCAAKQDVDTPPEEGELALLLAQSVQSTLVDIIGETVASAAWHASLDGLYRAYLAAHVERRHRRRCRLLLRMRIEEALERRLTAQRTLSVRYRVALPSVEDASSREQQPTCMSHVRIPAPPRTSKETVPPAFHSPSASSSSSSARMRGKPSHDRVGVVGVERQWQRDLNAIMDDGLVQWISAVGREDRNTREAEAADDHGAASCVLAELFNIFAPAGQDDEVEHAAEGNAKQVEEGDEGSCPSGQPGQARDRRVCALASLLHLDDTSAAEMVRRVEADQQTSSCSCSDHSSASAASLPALLTTVAMAPWLAEDGEALRSTSTPRHQCDARVAEARDRLVRHLHEHVNALLLCLLQRGTIALVRALQRRRRDAVARRSRRLSSLSLPRGESATPVRQEERPSDGGLRVEAVPHHHNDNVRAPAPLDLSSSSEPNEPASPSVCQYLLPDDLRDGILSPSAAEEDENDEGGRACGVSGHSGRVVTLTAPVEPHSRHRDSHGGSEADTKKETSLRERAEQLRWERRVLREARRRRNETAQSRERRRPPPPPPRAAYARAGGRAHHRHRIDAARERHAQLPPHGTPRATDTNTAPSHSAVSFHDCGASGASSRARSEGASEKSKKSNSSRGGRDVTAPGKQCAIM